MFITEGKLRNRANELKWRRYFAHEPIAPFVAMEGQLSEDESNICMPEKIEGGSFDLNDVFEGRDRYLWIEKEVTFPEAKEGCEIVGLFDFGETGHGGNSGFESLLYLDGHGESLVRQFLHGTRFFEQEFDDQPFTSVKHDTDIFTAYRTIEGMPLLYVVNKSSGVR